MEPLRTHIDFETRNLVDIKLGEHVYARHWSCAPLMLTIGTAPRGKVPDTFETIDFFKAPGYADAVRVQLDECLLSVRPERKSFKGQGFVQPCPASVLAAIERGDTFVAHNARFEQAIYYYICHLEWGWPLPVRWSCTAARSRYFGIRASLEGSASDLEVLNQKDARGKTFIDTHCKPRKYKGPKRDGIVKELWAEPHESQATWDAGLEYCETDGRAEADIDALLPDLPPFEQWAWEWDYTINWRGVPLDMQSVDRAIAFSDHFTARANQRFEEITALRPTQRDRVLEYLNQREEIDNLGDLRSKTLKRIVANEFPQDLQDVIQIRLDASLASVKKLEKMREIGLADGFGNAFAYGGHLYGGAHTMRWSHKRLQTGNMKRSDKDVHERMFEYLEGPWWNELGHNGGPPLDLVDLFDEYEVEYEKPAWVDAAEWRFMRPLQALSVSMKGFIKAIPGHELIDGDYSQIEARVLAWLARCEWLLEAFRNKEDPYVKFGAEHMYKVKYEDCFTYDKNGKRQVAKHFKRQRQIAKSAVLGAGFGLGKPKFVEYCDNSDLIITYEEADETITAYRDAHPEIVALWDRVERCAITAVTSPGQIVELGGTGVKFYTWHIDEERFWLVRQDPSGSCQHYYRPKVEYITRFGRLKPQLTFRTEWNGKSYRESTYGGKLVENMVQKIARDILVAGGKRTEAAGYPSIMLVHDSNVTMPRLGHGSPEELAALMCVKEDWMTDLPVEAEAGRMIRYA